MRQKVLVFGMNYAPELAGVGRYTGEIAEFLQSRGSDVVVVTTPAHYPGWTVQKPFKRWSYSVEQRNGVKVIRCPLLLRRNIGGNLASDRPIDLCNRGSAGAFLAVFPLPAAHRSIGRTDPSRCTARDLGSRFRGFQNGAAYAGSRSRCRVRGRSPRQPHLAEVSGVLLRTLGHNELFAGHYDFRQDGRQDRAEGRRAIEDRCYSELGRSRLDPAVGEGKPLSVRIADPGQRVHGLVLRQSRPQAGTRRFASRSRTPQELQTHTLHHRRRGTRQGSDQGAIRELCRPCNCCHFNPRSGCRSSSDWPISTFCRKRPAWRTWYCRRSSAECWPVADRSWS